MRCFFSKKWYAFFFIKLGQRLSKSFSQLHVKNSRFFLSYFSKKDDWPKAYASPKLPILSYWYYYVFASLWQFTSLIILWPHSTNLYFTFTILYTLIGRNSLRDYFTAIKIYRWLSHLERGRQGKRYPFLFLFHYLVIVFLHMLKLRTIF